MEKKISTFKGNQYVDSGGAQLGNHQKQPKTNENLAKEDACTNDMMPKTSESRVQNDHLNKKTYDVIAEEMKVLRKTNQPYIL